jgi:hypothetical protein
MAKQTTTKTPTAYTKEMHAANQAAAMNGTMRDDLNPAFILSRTYLELVCKIAKGEINIQDLALLELEGRHKRRKRSPNIKNTNKMKNLKQLESNTLSELSAMIYRIQQEIKTFSHCSESKEYQETKVFINKMSNKIDAQIIYSDNN